MNEEQIHSELLKTYASAMEANILSLNERINRQSQEEEITEFEKLNRVLYWHADAILTSVATQLARIR